MFLPPISSPSYLPPERMAGPRAVGAATAVEAVLRRETQPELGPEEQRRLDQLRSRDRELRQHERVQVLLGGTLLRTLPSYTYERGPDGDFYAVEGMEKVDMSGRGMLDPALARHTEPRTGARPAAEERAAQPTPATAAEPVVVPPRTDAAPAPHRIADSFAAAAARFYLASAAAGPRQPIVDLFA